MKLSDTFYSSTLCGYVDIGVREIKFYEWAIERKYSIGEVIETLCEDIESNFDLDVSWEVWRYSWDSCKEWCDDSR